MRLLVTTGLLLCSAAVCLADHHVHTISNKSVKGKVVAITDVEVRVIDTEGKEVSTPLSQVIAIDLRPVGGVPTDAKYSIIQLFESRLYCSKLGFKGNTVEATLLSGQEFSLPLNQIISILHQGNEAAVRNQWEKLLTANTKSDRILKLQKDGTLEALDGSLGDVDPAGKKIQFQYGGKILPIPLQNLTGLVYYRPQAPAKSAACIVYDTLGNKIAASSVSVEGDNFVITIPSGGKLTLAEKSLAKFDYNQGKLLFLSDMAPIDVLEESNIGLEFGLKYRKDTNLEGDPIVLGKNTYPKGLTLHAHTELEYNLDGKYKDFKALLGVDARAKTESKAVVTIEGDGNQLFKGKVDGQKETPLNLNLRNVRKLRIIVTSDDLLQLHDQATLAEARISQ